MSGPEAGEEETKALARGGMAERPSDLLVRDMSLQRKLSLHFLDANRFGADDRLVDGYRKITTHHLGDKKIYRISTIFQLFGYATHGEQKGGRELLLLYQYNANTQLVKQVTSSSHTSRAHESYLYRVNFMQLFGAIVPT